MGPFSQQVLQEIDFILSPETFQTEVQAFHFSLFFSTARKKSNYIVKIKRRKTNLQYPLLSHLNLTNYHVIRNHHVLTQDSDSGSSAIGLNFF